MERINKDEYISISEFAKRAGVSRQAVYARLDGDLSTFCQVDKGKKYLPTRALEFFTVKFVNKELTPFDILVNELEVKNKQIKQLQTQVYELNEERRKLSENLLSLSDKVGNSLQSISQTQLADKLIEGKALITESESIGLKPKKKRWWQLKGN